MSRFWKEGDRAASTSFNASTISTPRRRTSERSCSNSHLEKSNLIVRSATLCNPYILEQKERFTALLSAATFKEPARTPKGMSSLASLCILCFHVEVSKIISMQQCNSSHRLRRRCATIMSPDYAFMLSHHYDAWSERRRRQRKHSEEVRGLGGSGTRGRGYDTTQ